MKTHQAAAEGHIIPSEAHAEVRYGLICKRTPNRVLSGFAVIDPFATFSGGHSTQVDGYLGRMSIRKRADREYAAHLQGTLDLLILRTLLFGPQHGQGVARTIQQQSDNVLIVDHGSLYPALQRLEDRRFISAEWGVSDNNRKARFYRLTQKRRKELTREESEWRRIAAAIGRVLDGQPRKA